MSTMRSARISSTCWSDPRCERHAFLCAATFSWKPSICQDRLRPVTGQENSQNNGGFRRWVRRSRGRRRRARLGLGVGLGLGWRVMGVCERVVEAASIWRAGRCRARRLGHPSAVLRTVLRSASMLEATARALAPAASLLRRQPANSANEPAWLHSLCRREDTHILTYT
jgi:hypothetical protein